MLEEDATYFRRQVEPTRNDIASAQRVGAALTF
jgi:hypothetical protein